RAHGERRSRHPRLIRFCDGRVRPMKTVDQMTPEEKARIRAWFQKWDEVAPIMENLRLEAIRSADTMKAIAAFDGAFETSIRDLPPKPYSGLVEQQRLFKLARK